MNLELKAFGVLWHAWSKLRAITVVMCFGKLINTHMLNCICFTIQILRGGYFALSLPGLRTPSHWLEKSCKPWHNFIILRSESIWYHLASQTGYKSIIFFWGERPLHFNACNTLPNQHEDNHTKKLVSLTISTNISHFNIVLPVQDRGGMARKYDFLGTKVVVFGSFWINWFFVFSFTLSQARFTQ